MQDLALAEAAEIYKILVLEKGHFYVCGDCTMAEHVYQTLKTIIQKYGSMSNAQVEKYMHLLRVGLIELNCWQNLLAGCVDITSFLFEG